MSRRTRCRRRVRLVDMVDRVRLELGLDRGDERARDATVWMMEREVWWEEWGGISKHGRPRPDPRVLEMAGLPHDGRHAALRGSDPMRVTFVRPLALAVVARTVKRMRERWAWEKRNEENHQKWLAAEALRLALLPVDIGLDRLAGS